MKYNLICFTVGVLLGLFLGIVYCTATFNNNTSPVPIPSTKELQKEVTHFETGYRKSFDSLKNESAKLGSALNTAKTELQRAKQRSQLLQGQVYDLLDSRFERQKSDTIVSITSCDSLSVTVRELMQANEQKDTLYEHVTTNLEDQVKNKDSTLALKDSQYSQLKLAFDHSVNNQTLLVEQNKILNKEYRKQKLKSKFLSATLFVLSGAAAAYLLRH
jgi:hypothetical protein